MSSKGINVPEGWKSSFLANGWFRIVHPDSWEVEQGDSFTTIEDPAGVASIGVVLALRASSSLAEFADVCFQVELPFDPVTDRTTAANCGWMEGVFQDFLNPTVADPEDTSRRIFCLRSNDLYAKVTFYSHRRWLDSREYSQVVESIKVEGMRVVGAP